MPGVTYSIPVGARIKGRWALRGAAFLLRFFRCEMRIGGGQWRDVGLVIDLKFEHPGEKA